MAHEQVLREMEGLANPASPAGMARFGITPARALGVRMPDLRRLARRIGAISDLASQLWSDAIRETKIIAGTIQDPASVTEAQVEE